MSKPLRFERLDHATTTRATPPTMALGDVLQRLAIVSPDDLKAIDALARTALERALPTTKFRSARASLGAFPVLHRRPTRPVS